MPPLTTRPKAATVGVGRQVILRPAVQKRYLELTEPSLADQASDVERVLAQLEDLEPRAELAVLKTLGRTLREADYKVTAVVVDDVLIAVEPGDTTARRFGIAFDLGTTTVVATLLDLSTGTPVAVESMLNKQQPFGADVITRISATMMDPGALDKLQQLATETLGELARAVVRARRRRAGRGVRGRGGGQRHHDPPGARHRSGAARHGPVHHGRPAVSRGARAPTWACLASCTPGPARWCSPRSARTWAATSRPACWPAGWTGTRRVRLFIDIGTNCEIVLGNREWLLATAAPAGPRSRAPRSGAGCAPPTGPSRS